MKRSRDSAFKTPAINQPASKSSTSDNTSQSWSVQWRNPQFKKHKTWDGDGTLTIKSGQMVLKDTNSSVIGRSFDKKNSVFEPGAQFVIGGKDVELDQLLKSEATKENSPKQLKGVPAASFYTSAPSAAKPYKPPTFNKSPKATTDATSSKFVPSPLKQGEFQQQDTVTPQSSSLSSVRKSPKQAPAPKHDPNAPDALVMPTIPPEIMAEVNYKQQPTVDVVLDPHISSKLRPHQREGVKFMYEAVMGMRGHKGNGCILADEMGLGKTLQVIALIWTLLKQNPIANSGPVIGKAMIVCPVSLVNNWRKEFSKWIGQSKIGVFLGDKDVTEIKKFQQSRIHQVLIIGYEKLRTAVDVLKFCQPQIGLIVCDEGHRLKASNKTSQVFEAFPTRRRIILSGTPIQNDLGEYYCMTDFCNPGLLDSYSTFKKKYETPIMRSRAPNCNKSDLELGRQRSEALSSLTNQFVLRRTAEILDNVLPTKSEFVVFIAPTQLQILMYRQLVQASIIQSVLERLGGQHLNLIGILRNLCNSPGLIQKMIDNKQSDSYRDFKLENIRSMLSGDVNANDINLSGKLKALGRLLKSLKNETEEKIIVVSSFTTTLDLIESHCRLNKYKFCRLDGSTPQAKRQEIVDGFNRSPQGGKFVFLLSTKSGGVGLNLIGASRLVLFESDWNPSNDLQAMARIHRDGQTKPVFIYRFLTTGTIDEKIFQRQLTKIGLSNSLMGNTVEKKNDTDSFTLEELRALFKVDDDTACGTHDLLDCNCNTGSAVPTLDDVNNEDEDKPQGFVSASQHQPGMSMKSKRDKQAKIAALEGWEHVDCLQESHIENLADDILRKLTICPQISKPAEDDNSSPANTQPTIQAHQFESLEDYCPASDEEPDEAGDENMEVSRPENKEHEDKNDEHGKQSFDMTSFLQDANNEGRVTFVFKKVSGSVV
ncbi:hypothetical protein E3P99_01542 [Wallemia hederae]|uniref:DNA repair and recombination protein RAD54B n=1 Tax=Wallemia hederae TaxID=1540922 RepID=A0A4T0FPR1_9BASI|nr:hypothetical protein E3P99_01542 [Wallemia hederae]